MTIYSIYVINKAGGLIYRQDFQTRDVPLSANDVIVLAGMFHGLHAITARLSPEPKSKGMEVMVADTFRLHCFHTVTGTKFVVLADPAQTTLDHILKKLYELYADYVLKNPFYSLEMPIRCELFEKQLTKYIDYVEANQRNYAAGAR